MLQIISLVGAVTILAAYIANQFGLGDPSRLSYQASNLVGSAVLGAVALIETQLGFLLLEGAWALISLWGIFTILKGGGSSSAER